MDLKNQIEQNMQPSKRHHFIRRLAKATQHADLLVRLTADRCDARSNLEAEAYSAWLSGTLLLEKETEWETALAHFIKSQQLLEELFKLGDFDQRATCRHFLDQVEPAIRFCEYQINRRGGRAADAAALLNAASGTSGPASDVLASKLASLAAEAQAQRAVSTSELIWNGETLPVRDERCKIAVHAAQELQKELLAAFADFTAATADSNKGNDGMEGIEGAATEIEPIISLFDRTINAYSDARAAVRAAAQVGHQGGTAEAIREELAALGRALHALELQHTISRNLALADSAARRLDVAMKRKLKGASRKEKGERPARPEDVARLYDTLVANATELNDLAAEVGGARGEVLMDECAAKTAHYQAGRCTYAAYSYLSAGQRAEAAALLERAIRRCKEAKGKYDDCAAPDEAGISHVEVLARRSIALRAIAVAEIKAAEVRRSEAAAAGVDSLELHEDEDDQDAVHAAKKAKKVSSDNNGYLADNLDTWQAFAGARVGAARIIRMPLPPPMVPLRPIVLDTALMCIEPPSVEHRTSKKGGKGGTTTAAGQSGMVSRLFGWG